MAEPAALSREQLVSRLEKLLEGLNRFPASLTCPWPVARIFNELLKQSRTQAVDDPILKGIRFFEETPTEFEPAASNALIGTVALLSQQVIVALEAAPSTAAPKQPRAPRATTKAAR